MTSHTKTFEANKTYSPHVIFILLTFKLSTTWQKFFATIFWLPLIDLFRKLNLVLLSFDFSPLASLFLCSCTRFAISGLFILLLFFISLSLLFLISHVISFGYVCCAFCHEHKNILFSLFPLPQLLPLV